MKSQALRAAAALIAASSFSRAPCAAQRLEREGAASTALGKKLYAFGGCDSNGTCYNDLWEFDGHHWELIKTTGEIPSARQDATLTAFRASYLILFGGSTEQGPTSDIHAFDLKEREWIIPHLTQGEELPVLSGHLAATDGSNFIWVFGGHGMNQDYHNDMHIFDMDAFPESDAATGLHVSCKKAPKIGAVPPSREKAAGDIVNGIFYVFGGYAANSVVLHDFYGYNIDTSRWAEIVNPLHPQARQGAAGLRHGHSLVITGGCNISKNIQMCYNDTWAYDADGNKWAIMSTGNHKYKPRQNHAAGFLHPSTLVIHGGSQITRVLHDTVMIEDMPPCGFAKDCSGHGLCIAAACHCHDGFAGHDCGLVDSCPHDCYGNGVCKNNACHCRAGTGIDCYLDSPCPGSSIQGWQCNANGHCDRETLTCRCFFDSWGHACQFGTQRKKKTEPDQTSDAQTDKPLPPRRNSLPGLAPTPRPRAELLQLSNSFCSITPIELEMRQIEKTATVAPDPSPTPRQDASPNKSIDYDEMARLGTRIISIIIALLAAIGTSLAALKA